MQNQGGNQTLVHIMDDKVEAPQFLDLTDRLHVCKTYERYMHRNYPLPYPDGNVYEFHSMFVAFDTNFRAYVAMSNNRSHKDVQMVPLAEFDKLIKPLV